MTLLFPFLAVKMYFETESYTYHTLYILVELWSWISLHTNIVLLCCSARSILPCVCWVMEVAERPCIAMKRVTVLINVHVSSESISIGEHCFFHSILLQSETDDCWTPGRSCMHVWQDRFHQNKGLIPSSLEANEKWRMNAVALDPWTVWKATLTRID